MSLENGSLNLEREKTNKELFKDFKKIENKFDALQSEMSLSKNSQGNNVLKLKGKDWVMEKCIFGDGQFATFFLYKNGKRVSLTINNNLKNIEYFISETHSSGYDSEVIGSLIDKFKKKIEGYYIEYPDKLIEKKKEAIQDKKDKIKDLKAIKDLGSINVLDPEKMLEDMA